MAYAAPAVLRSPVAAPGPAGLRLPDLLRATDLAADAVLNGDYDHLLPAGGLPADGRWFTRIHGDDDLDIWLISWVPGHATELHDHGASQGALTVLAGSLHEHRFDAGELKTRRLDAGDQAAFPLGWVHDVVWASGPDTPGADTAGAEVSGPTLSVHAYSPPLTEMSYYRVTGAGALHRQRTELTEHPEAS